MAPFRQVLLRTEIVRLSTSFGSVKVLAWVWASMRGAALAVHVFVSQNRASRDRSTIQEGLPGCDL